MIPQRKFQQLLNESQRLFESQFNTYSALPQNINAISKAIRSYLKKEFGSRYESKAFEWYLHIWHNMTPDEWEDYEGEEEDITGDYELFIINEWFCEVTNTELELYKIHPGLSEYFKSIKLGDLSTGISKLAKKLNL